MIFLLFGLLLSLAGIMKEFLEKKAETRSTDPPKRGLFLYWGTALTFLGAIVTFWSGCDAKISQVTSDKLHDSAYRHLEDSLHIDLVKKLENNSQTSLKTYTSALAQYHLEYVNGQVGLKSYLKDSLNPEMPGMFIPTASIKHTFDPTKQLFSISFPIANTGNCTILVNLDAYICFDFDHKLYYGYKIPAVWKNRSVAQGTLNEYPTDVQFHNDIPNRTYFRFTGNYFGLTKKKKTPIDEVVICDSLNGQIGIPTGQSFKDSIVRFFRAHKKDTNKIQ
jgi:hypothetical protein